MAKYRKKPVVIEAVQFHEKTLPHPDGVYWRDDRKCWWVSTLEGGHVVSEGDWIITGVQGEKYPCKPDIFSATYEPA